MGLFDKVIGTTNEKLNDKEGFAGIALCAVAADGVITEEEALGLGTTMNRMKLFRGLNQRQMNDIFGKLVRVVKSQGVDNLMKHSAEAVPADLKPTAFAVAADLLFADGEVAPAEQKFLEKIQYSLGVPDDLALKVVEVIALKNKG
ncbi:MAG: tellurite resistance TerB family protein [Euryarchaeota archaeon]|nr:tellurite resistance TerB family protein [Euryarchaeota archaeon]